MSIASTASNSSDSKSSGSKNPAMVLFEYALREKTEAKYFEKESPYDHDFQFKVTVGDITAVGIGKSKQIAKQNAAFNALTKLINRGHYENEHIQLNDLRMKLPDMKEFNFMGELHSICLANKINLPSFIFLSGFGPQHNRKYCYESRIDSVRTQATSFNKKQARQECAALMITKIKSIIPPETYLTPAALKYTPKSEGLKNLEDKGIKIVDIPSQLARKMRQKKLTPSDFIEDLQFVNEMGLQRILRRFGAQYEFLEIVQLESGKFLSSLDIKIGIPFTFMATGETKKKAKQAVLERAFEAFKSYINVFNCN